ncbi:GNAT family N-acetyltransferase [Hwanghaeella grinnelliae]|uniref:GNAT family N-acetyltransferase n=1 Tax=Hwanghaeella grinnelliae TaxID=2500179 RepID=UPI00196132CF|nr:GNAT family N-acetyltransferase [Hwanghaeella grinnelliae]
MARIGFAPLQDIAEEDLIALMNEPAVGHFLPLLGDGFTAADCRAFLVAKQALWDAHGYGPWAFLIDGDFAGWGGLQPEQGDADFAMVLHPRFWGWGRRIFTLIKVRAFGEMGLTSITALLPPARTNANAIKRLGFVEDGSVHVDGERFRRFRLCRDAGQKA